MKQFRLTLWTSLSLLLMITITAAATQEEVCPAVVRTALELTEKECSDTGRNQACYGHVSLQAELQEGYEDLTFEQTGDMIDLAALQSMRLSALDTQNDLWGVALMRVQANMPNSQPDLNAQFLLFGDVQIESAVPEVEPIPAVIYADGNVNIRRSPRDEGFVLASLPPGEIVEARGISPDGNWVNIDFPGNEDEVGWISRRFITSDADLEALPVLDALSATYGPMQAFYLETSASGGSEMNCAEAPRDGILIQTPEGAGKVRLWINEVRIQLGSTAFIQAEPDSEMTVQMLEGEAEVSAQGVSYRAPAGTEVSVRTDKDNKPSEPPKPPKPLQVEDVAGLPVEDLDRPVDIPAPLSEEEIVEQNLDEPTPTVDDDELVDPTVPASEGVADDTSDAGVVPTENAEAPTGETPVSETAVDEPVIDEGVSPTDEAPVGGSSPTEESAPSDETPVDQGTGGNPPSDETPPSDDGSVPPPNDGNPSDTGDQNQQGGVQESGDQNSGNSEVGSSSQETGSNDSSSSDSGSDEGGSQQQSADPTP
jgi:hypothetical protein